MLFESAKMELSFLMLTILCGLVRSEKSEVRFIENHPDMKADTDIINHLISTVNHMKQFETQTRELLAEQSIIIRTLDTELGDAKNEIAMIKRGHGKKLAEQKNIINGLEKKMNNHEIELSIIQISRKRANVYADNRIVKTSNENISSPFRTEDITHSKLKKSHNIETETDGMTDRRRSFPEQNVAFFATLGTTVEHLGKGQSVKFENVVTNIGNAYNPFLGAFIAPSAGTYAFSTTITTLGAHISHYGFFKNAKQLTTIYVNGAQSSFDSTCGTIVIQLATGDAVEIRSTDNDHAVTGANYSMFSGFLLIDYANDNAIVG